MTTFDERAGGAGLPEGFAELAPLVYRDDPRWIPEDPAVLGMMFSPHNPWFKRGRAQLFCLPGQARAAAFFNPEARIDGRPVAFFGYWETCASLAVDRELLEAISAWARTQGAVELWGPINFSTAGSYRLILSHEDDFLPFPGEPYNPSDYPARLERLGFGVRELYSSYLGDRAGIQRVIDELAAWRGGLLDKGFTIEPITLELWKERVDEFHALTNAIYRDNLGFTPFSKEEFLLAAGPSLVKKACPIASVAARAPSGEIAGIVLSFPDWGPLVVQGRGAERVPAGAIEHAKHFEAVAQRPPVRLLTKTVGTSPSFRGQRIFESLWVESLIRSQAIYDQMLGCLIRDGNFSGRVVDRLYVRARRYGLFARPL